MVVARGLYLARHLFTLYNEYRNEETILENLHRFKMEQEGPPLGVITNFVSQPDRDVKIKFTKR